ncbi:MAG: hypothetical protein IKY02_03060 [Lachnospiraceae bacterium]|nr:hypothetical protein [Lachnospiraceae bacterium]
MQLKTQTFKLRTANCDVNRRLRLSELFNWFQEIAIADTEEHDMGRDKTLDKGLLWVVTGYRVEIGRLPEYDETITLESWAGKTMHIFFPRYFRMKDAGGNVLLQASSFWVLIDAATRKVIFPEEAGVYMDEVVVEGAPGIPRPPRIGETPEEVPFTVTYSVLDLNGHMNNTRYFDAVQDAIYPLKKAAPPKLILVEFKNEARPGETFMIRYGEQDGTVSVVGEADRMIFRMGLSY